MAKPRPTGPSGEGEEGMVLRGQPAGGDWWCSGEGGGSCEVSAATQHRALGSSYAG